MSSSSARKATSIPCSWWSTRTRSPSSTSWTSRPPSTVTPGRWTATRRPSPTRWRLGVRGDPEGLYTRGRSRKVPCWPEAPREEGWGPEGSPAAEEGHRKEGYPGRGLWNCRGQWQHVPPWRWRAWRHGCPCSTGRVIKRCQESAENYGEEEKSKLWYNKPVR